MLRRKRILVLDDDRNARDVVAAILSAEGFYIAGLDRSPGVLDSVHAQRPDLVITDVLMPEVDGIQVLTRLRGAGYRGKVLVLSALPVEDGEFEGADAALRKPFELDDLLAAVERLIGKAQ